MQGGGAAEVAARVRRRGGGGWLGEIGRLAPAFRTRRGSPPGRQLQGNYMSAKKSKGGRTGDGGNYIKRCWSGRWAAVRVAGSRLGSTAGRGSAAQEQRRDQARDMAIAHTLLKIAYQVSRPARLHGSRRRLLR